MISNPNFFFVIGLLMISTASGYAWFDAPELIQPEENARFGIESEEVVFMWTSDNAEDYQLELAVDETFELTTGPLSTSSQSIYNIYDLIPEDIWLPLTIKIYWRVRGVYSLGITGPWSDARIFFKTDFENPTILSFKDGRYSPYTDMPVLEWSEMENAYNYTIEFANDEAFDDYLGSLICDDPILDFSVIDRTDWDPIEGVFYWRIFAVTEEGLPSPYSDTCRLSKTLLPPPVPIYPEDSTRFPAQSDPFYLEWEPVTDNDHYQIRLSADDEGLVEIMVIDFIGTRYDFGVELEIPAEEWWYLYVNFYWSVASFDSVGRAGPYSVPRELTKIGYHRVAAYGDSITAGKCYPNGYSDLLSDHLSDHWERHSMANIALPGAKSKWGADNIVRKLQETAPEYILIMFGINDTVDPYHCDPPNDCQVLEHLTEIIEVSRSRGSIPILSTVLPVNPEGDLAIAQDNIDELNEAILEMADELLAPIVDLNAMFWSDDHTLSELFCDWGHPNYDGYLIMARGFYQGILDHEP